MDYLSLPFRLKEDYLARADSLEESIEFGCNIWDMEFSDIDTANKSDIRASLRNAIDEFEKRLYNVSVTFAMVSGTSIHQLGMKVKVTGDYREDGEEKRFEGTYSLG
jgi:phage baseplate assembly protein W